VENNAYVLTITNMEQLARVTILVNGYLRTPKIVQFAALVAWLNANGGQSLKCLPINTSDILKDAWASGFFDADGSFDVQVRSKVEGKPSSKNRVIARFLPHPQRGRGEWNNV
jgi:hypothetical protein